MPFGKAPAWTPARFADDGLDSRPRGDGMYLGTKPVPATRRTPFGPTVNDKIFFIGFKAGMLLKTRGSRTKHTNFERLFPRKCTDFGVFETNWTGFARFAANPEIRREAF